MQALPLKYCPLKNREPEKRGESDGKDHDCTGMPVK